MSPPSPARTPAFAAFRGLLATPTLPDLGPRPRPDRLSLEELGARLERFLGDWALPRALQPWLRSAALLWHDHLDASHELAQRISGPDGSYLHALMHRREPDYGNARYWFLRVGRHGAFPEIARRAAHHLPAENERHWLVRLAPNGLWDPFAFLDACAELGRAGDDDPGRALLRRVQQWEFDALVEHVLGATLTAERVVAPKSSG